MAQLFKLLFVLLLLCYTLCVSVCVSSNKEIKKEESVELFKPTEDKIKAVKNHNGDDEILKDGMNYEGINLPQLLVAAKGNVMVAVTEAKFTKKTEASGGGGGDKKSVNVVTKYIKTEKENEWNFDNIKDVENKWTTQIATENSRETDTVSKVIFSVVNEESNKIYVFLLNSTSAQTDNLPFNVKLNIGTVNINENAKEKLITWEHKELTVLKTAKTTIENFDEKKLLLDDASGSAFLLKDNKIVCFVKCKYKEGTNSGNEKSITAVFQLKETKKMLELLHVEYIDDKHLSFFQWKKELFKTPKNKIKSDNDKVMVFNTNKNDFEQSDSSIARLRDLLKNKNNFATVTIKNKCFLLFTEEKTKDDGKKDVNLWMSDGTRAYCVGNIISDIEDTFYGSILYINNELLALHQKYNNQNTKKHVANTFSLTRLKELLDNMTFILDAWEESNKVVVELCRETNIQDNVCTTPLLIDGLVGFLYNVFNKDNNKKEWKDEYFYSNATFENGKMMPDGMKFSGAGHGAKWPMGKDKNDQTYNFNDPGFTLVATVTIDSDTNKKVNSVLGVGLENSGKKSVGLWCTADGKWSVNDKNDQNKLKPLDADCASKEAYQVALILNNSNICFYINGRKLTLSENQQISIQKTEIITHFYLGVDVGNEQKKKEYESHTTVKNVILYNKPVTEEVVTNLKPKPKQQLPANTPLHKVSKETDDKITDEPQKDDNNSSSTSGTLELQTINNEGDVSLRLTDSAVFVCDIVVGVFLFGLFGVGVVTLY